MLGTEKILIAIILFFPLFATSQEPKVKFTSHKNGDWVGLSRDPGVQLLIEGETSNFSEGGDIRLSIRSKNWKTKVDNVGRFKFSVDLDIMKPQSKNKVRIEALKKGQIVSEQTIDIFCCSDEKYGFYQELVPGQDHNILVNKPGTAMNGLRIKIPGKNLKKASNVFVSIHHEWTNIPLKYVPIGSPIHVGFSGDVEFIDPIEFSLLVQPIIPRGNMGKKVDIKDWEYLRKRKWKKIDITAAKIIVLEVDDEVKEIVPTSVVGNRVEFKASATFLRTFLPVAVVDDAN